MGVRSDSWMRIGCLMLAVATPGGLPVAQGSEAAILRQIRDFFGAGDAATRRAIAQKIQADPEFDPAQMSRWLHEAVAFEPLTPGRHVFEVPLRDGTRRRVVLRIPDGYDATRPWPVIYALHGQGGTAEGIVRYFERVLGPAVEQYVLAAPDQYDEFVIHQTRWPPLAEHPALLRAIRKKVHTDADRIYACGYSRGGHTSWTVGVLYADQFAGIMPLAGTFLCAEVDALWDDFLPNLAHVPVLCVWGERDVQGNDGRPSADGGIAGLNRMLRGHVSPLKLDITMTELAGVGHGGVRPPAEAMRALLKRRRVHDPPRVRQVFRHTSQARCYWLEGESWVGPVWDDKPPQIRLGPGQSPRDTQAVRAALVRWYRSRLGQLRGRRNGNHVRVYRKNVKALTVWFGLESMDFGQPVTLVVSGRKVFEGRLKPDVWVCLSQAARTYDLDRLRWAGLRFRSGHRTRVVGAEGDSPRRSRRRH